MDPLADPFLGLAGLIIFAVLVVAAILMVFLPFMVYSIMHNMKRVESHLRTLADASTTASEKRRERAEETMAPSGMIPAEKFAEERGIPRQTVIDALRSGTIPGREIDGKWYLSVKTAEP